MTARGERLQKVLASAGLGSRRSVERLIDDGRVTINGRRAQLGARVNTNNDKVEVDGSPVPVRPELAYFLMNKPAGVVTTASDPHGRTTVMDYVPTDERLWPVGRLDIATEGALLLTNDGELTFRLTHPSFHVPKTYLAEVRGSVGAGVVRRLERGLELDDGPTAPARVVVRDRSGSSSLVEMTIREGRHRQVRRMFDEVGHPVTRLARIGIGPVSVGRLRPGTVRRLTPEEVTSLYAACRRDHSVSTDQQDDLSL